MELLFGDGSGSAFIFYKDKGGKGNHMRLRITVQENFYPHLVYEDKSDIPDMFWNLKNSSGGDVPLLCLDYQDKDGQWQPMTVRHRYSLRGTVNLRFKLCHVSRRHHSRNFILHFCRSRDDKVLFATPVVEVRSKLKSASFYARRRKAKECVNDKTTIRSTPPATKKRKRLGGNDFTQLADMVQNLEKKIGTWNQVLQSQVQMLQSQVQMLQSEVKQWKDLQEIELQHDLTHFKF